MMAAPCLTKSEQVSGALKSFVQQLRTKLAKQSETVGDHEVSKSEWDALDTALFSPEACDRRVAIAQILQSADPSTKKSITDWLLFNDNSDDAIDAMISRHQQQREAA